MNGSGPVALALYLILLLPLVLVIFDSLCRLVFLAILLLPEAHGEQPVVEDRKLRLLVLVVAHNEEKAIERTLRLVKDQTEPGELSRLVVLADHCSDGTVSMAARMGARVYERKEGVSGKAQALSWFVQHAGDVLSTTDIVVVLDADTLVEARFCCEIRAGFGTGVGALQSFVKPVSRNGFPLTTLVSFSEILSEKIDDAGRSRLHWSVPLRGTGMAFRAETFMAACQALGTQVDDIELSVRLAEMRVPVLFRPAAVVNDPKSDRPLGLARQRGRWLKGQRQVWKTKGRTIMKLLRSGPSNWSLIQAMLLKPKTALSVMRLILIALLWAWPFPHTIAHNVVFSAVLASLLIDVLYYISGLSLAGNAGKYMASLLTSPILLILWAISWAYSLLPTQEWLQARKE
jgi:cellulose synthase/poly-beta-1,6-N-acetylglucosamine synthase-like glycosyltransferase